MDLRILEVYMAIMIRTQKLKKEYGSKGAHYPALNGVDLNVYQGEFGNYGAFRLWKNHTSQFIILN